MNWALLLSFIALLISISYWHRPLAIVTREEWRAEAAESLTPMDLPVSYVIISHTASHPCENMERCMEAVRFTQRFHQKSRKWWDIGYNFLVGGDGRVYEGRGWDAVGAHARYYNNVSIGISFVGTFTDVVPSQLQILAAKSLIEEGVRLGKITQNYKLLAHRQISPTESPGEKLFEDIKTWEHWSEIV